VLVPQSGLETARQVLLEADLLGGSAPVARPGRVLAGLLAACGLVGIATVIIDTTT
jgi:hypothetical protein